MRKASVFFLVFCFAVYAGNIDAERKMIHAKRSKLNGKVDALLEKIHANYIKSVSPIYNSASGDGFEKLAGEIEKEIKKLGCDSGTLKKDTKPSQKKQSEDRLKKSLNKARQGMTKKKIELANSCFKAGLIGTAYDLAFESFQSYPDQKDLRKLFGYRPAGDSWMRTYEYDMYRKGFIWDEKLGWIYHRKLDKYKAGQYHDGRGFIPLSEANKKHEDWKNPWVIETEHFIIKSNMDLETAVGVASRIESFYRQFFRYYVNYFNFNSRSAMEMLFKMENVKKLTVHYWKNQRDFLDHAIKINVSGMETSAGFYTSRTGTSQFYHFEHGIDPLLFHEVTHQILQEYGCAFLHEHAYWIVEGVAEVSETARVTGAFNVSFDPAKYRYLKKIKEGWRNKDIFSFMNISYDSFHGANRSMNYYMAGSLTTFFHTYDNGKYREDFVDYLRDLYFGKINGREIKIDRYLLVSKETLQKEFWEFINRN